MRKKYGDLCLEAACRRAVTVGDPAYRTAKGILVSGIETDPEPETGNAGAAVFLHGPEGLFAIAIPPTRWATSTTTRTAGTQRRPPDERDPTALRE